MAKYRLNVLSGDERVSRFFFEFESESEIKTLLNSIQDAADSGKTIKLPGRTNDGEFTQYLRPSNALSWNVFKYVPGEDGKGPDTNPLGDTGKWVGVLVEDSPLVQ
ncbi:MAG: hypothetical protein SOH95_00050 [Bifidobacterium crudilactis]